MKMLFRTCFSQVMIALLFIFGCTKSNEADRPLAVIEGKTISMEDFRNRAELTPRPQLHGSSGDEKRVLLELLINEKLLAVEAEQNGLNKTEEFRDLLALSEELSVSRELYTEEVQKKVTVSHKEAASIVEKMSETRTVAFLFARERNNLEELRNKLSNGATFDDIIRDQFGLAADTSKFRMSITWGNNEAAIDEAVYDLSMGSISPVIKTSHGYALFKLENIQKQIILSETDYTKLLHQAEKIQRARKESVRSDEFVSEVMKNVDVDIDENAFVIFSNSLMAHMNFNKNEDAQLRSNPKKLESSELMQAETILENHRDYVILRFSDITWNIDALMRKWKMINPPIATSSPNDCRRSIARTLSTMIRDKMLAEEGYKRGYARRQSVTKDVFLWQDYFLYNLQKQKIFTENSGKNDFDWKNYFQNIREKYHVEVNNELLAELPLTDIPVLAVRPGQYGSLAVPFWPIFESPQKDVQ